MRLGQNVGVSTDFDEAVKWTRGQRALACLSVDPLGRLKRITIVQVIEVVVRLGQNVGASIDFDFSRS